jgi:alpha-amylase
MKTVCFYFQVHQPFRLRRYRFFDINNDHYYYDDYLNELITHRVSVNSYLKTNKLLLSLIKKYKGDFKVSFSITVLALDQFQLYNPEVIDSFKQLAKTGCVEFLGETYSHSLASLINKDEFVRQVNEHSNLIESYFGQKPVVFRNTELIYSDDLGVDVSEMGFKGILAEGAKHILGWKSPNYLYCNQKNPKLKLLLRNYTLSDDIAFRFSNRGWEEYPLTAEKYVNWLSKVDKNDEVVAVFMDYETFGEHQKEDTGIFDFLKALPGQILRSKKFTVATPSEVISQLQPVSSVAVPYPASWADEERDLSAWLGNDLQDDAFHSLYKLTDKVRQCDDPVIRKDWNYLQASDHFYYMCNKFFSDGEVHSYFNPFESPYDAYINYMNVLSDFNYRIDDYLSSNRPVGPSKQKSAERISNSSLPEKKRKTIIKNKLNA